VKAINIEDARRIAVSKLRELQQEVECDLELIDQDTAETMLGWVFFYNSAEFLRTGDALWALAGNSPLFVSRDGALIELPTHQPWQQSVAEME